MMGFFSGRTAAGRKGLPCGLALFFVLWAALFPLSSTWAWVELCHPEMGEPFDHLMYVPLKADQDLELENQTVPLAALPERIQPQPPANWSWAILPGVHDLASPWAANGPDCSRAPPVSHS